MRILGVLKTSLDDWLQRHYQGVAIASLIVVAFTMFLDVSLVCFQRDLIYWRNLALEPLDPPRLMMSMAMGVPFRIAYRLVLHYLPSEWQELLLEKIRRRLFADFIVRRLLHQLALASQKLPKPGAALDLMDTATQQRFQEAQQAAYRAVQLFRRDANAVLDQQPCGPREESRYIVLEEDEEEVWQDDYARLDVLVTDQLLRDLLSPYGKQPSSCA